MNLFRHSYISVSVSCLKKTISSLTFHIYMSQKFCFEYCGLPNVIFDIIWLKVKTDLWRILLSRTISWCCFSLRKYWLHFQLNIFMLFLPIYWPYFTRSCLPRAQLFGFSAFLGFIPKFCCISFQIFLYFFHLFWTSLTFFFVFLPIYIGLISPAGCREQSFAGDFPRRLLSAAATGRDAATNRP